MNNSIYPILIAFFIYSGMAHGQNNTVELDGSLRLNAIDSSSSDSLLVWKSDSTIGFKVLAPLTQAPPPEIDTLMIVNNTLLISLVGDKMAARSVNLSAYDNLQALRDSMVSIRSAGYLTSFIEQDGDPTNELQYIDTFQLYGNELRISMFGDHMNYLSVDLSKYNDLQALTDSMTQIRSIGYLTSFQEQDGDPTNELQYIDTFQLYGNELRISMFGDHMNYLSVDLSKYNDLQALTDSMTQIRSIGYLTSFQEQDGDPTNELQRLDTFELVNNQLRISLLNDGVDVQSIDLSQYNNLGALQDSIASIRATGYLISFVELDGDVTNEIQDIDSFLIINDMLYLSLAKDNVPAQKVDLSSYNDKQELRDSIAAIRSSGYLSSAAGLDESATNEIQVLTLEQDSLKLSLGGGSVRIDTSSSNELQSLANVLTHGNSANMLTITDLLDPSSSQDAATKFYVDQKEKRIVDLIFRLEQSLGIDSIADIDGNYYKIGKINGTYWMLENLRTTRYQDGTMIDSVAQPSGWELNTTGAWSYYNLDATLNDTTGKLYNFHAVDNSRGLCPAGWVVASDFNWTEIVDFLDPTTINIDTLGVQSSVAGGFLKSTGTRQAMTGIWEDPNTEATNSVNFGAEPGGSINKNGVAQNDLWFFGYWWTSSKGSSINAFYRKMSYDSGEVIRQSSENLQPGFSVRCIKN